MIDSIRFKNFRALRDTSLDLGAYNLVVGPNGSGKSTLLEGLRVLSRPGTYSSSLVASAGLVHTGEVGVRARVDGEDLECYAYETSTLSHSRHGQTSAQWEGWKKLSRTRIYSLNERAIAAPVQLAPAMELQVDGGGLAGVLDRMRDEHPEAFEQLNQEIARLLPEFDRVLFNTPGAGTREFMLRTSDGHQRIHARDLSQGVLLALALLTLSYLPQPPSIIGLEEPDRGIHPRLYRDIQDALYRLSYPQSFGVDREPVQVIVTTHSPFMLDLHKDHPEEIIIAEKTQNGSQFHRLSDRPDLLELLDEVSLGEAWYSGILGGVPAAR